VPNCFERCGSSSTRHDNPTETNYIVSFTAQNGVGTESAMGESSRKIAADSDGGEVSGRGSCETNHVGVGAEEDRGRSKSEVGKDTGAGEEGCLESAEPASEPHAWLRVCVRGKQEETCADV
jgi:hypothetical protein